MNVLLLHYCLLGAIVFLMIPGGGIGKPLQPEPILLPKSNADSNATQNRQPNNSNTHSSTSPPLAATTITPMPNNSIQNSDKATNSVLPDVTKKTTSSPAPQPPPTVANPPTSPKPTTKEAPSETSDMAQNREVDIHPDTREEDVRHSNSAHSKPQPFRHESPDIFMPNGSKKTHGNTTAAAYAAAVCIVAAAVFYGSIIVWKRFAENRERNRGMLLTEDDMADLNDPDLRVFETASLQIEV